MFYLQLRRDVLNGRCTTSDDQAFRLAGLALQAEFEDWTERAKRAQLEHYLSSSVLRRASSKQAAFERLAKAHAQHFGMEDRQAELNYIQVGPLTLPPQFLVLFKLHAVGCLFAGDATAA